MFVQSTIIGSNDPVVISNINVVNDQGTILTVSNLTEIENNSYIGFFDLPREEFQFQVNGVDDNGYPFSYISDISVEPTTISLAFSKCRCNCVCVCVSLSTVVLNSRDR